MEPTRPQSRQALIDYSSVTVVIPTLDEAETIGAVIDEVRSIGIRNILVVDGHSKDGTPEIARSKGVPVIFQDGKGKADAIATALRYVRTPYVVIMDGDLTYPAAAIPILLRKLVETGCEEVIGARLKGRGNIPLVNRIGNRLITFVFNLLFGTRLRDVCSGMYAARTDTLRRIPIETKGFSIEVNIAALLASQGCRIEEVPIEYRPRPNPHKKKLKSLRDGPRIVLDTFRLALRYNPVFLFFMLGSLILIPGALIAAWVLLELMLRGIKHHVWALISVMMCSAGMVSLMLAILALYLKRLEIRLRQELRQEFEELRRLIRHAEA